MSSVFSIAGRVALCVALCVAAASVVACDAPPVAWRDPLPIAQPAATTQLVIDADSARFVAAAKPIALPPTIACRESAGTAVGPHATAAAWWAVRPDSSAVLYVAMSPDTGRTWGQPIAVDTLDVSTNGCSRPAPSVAVVGTDPYLAYAMVAREGTGVFFAHRMMGMVHSPVPVIYGERLVNTAIAADTNRVAVAFEEPNGTRKQVDVALSFTQGHLFEVHTQASRSVDDASTPVVAMQDSLIAVSWLAERRDADGTVRIVRVGDVRPWTN